jgi:hypothetical protein
MRLPKGKGGEGEKKRNISAIKTTRNRICKKVKKLLTVKSPYKVGIRANFHGKDVAVT